ncbi:unnamed protein product, partial [Prorocentrum cordatum]
EELVAPLPVDPPPFGEGGRERAAQLRCGARGPRAPRAIRELRLPLPPDGRGRRPRRGANAYICGVCSSSSSSSKWWASQSYPRRRPGAAGESQECMDMASDVSCSCS